MSRTYRTTTRLLGILQLMENGNRGRTVREVFEALQEQYPANERTYRRDLETLEYLGFLHTQEESSKDAARYLAVKSIEVGRNLTLNLRELLALYLARNVLAHLAETPLYGDLEALFSKIEKLLGPKAREYLKELNQEIQFDPGPRWGIGIKKEVLEALEHCCCESLELTCMYEAAHNQEARERRLGPHFLYFSGGSLYLVAEDLSDCRVKTFAVSRIRNASAKDAMYCGPKTNPESFLGSALGVFQGPPTSVELIFSGPHAVLAKEKRWHASQKISANKDGKVTMRLEVALTPELVSWVLSFGEGVEVVGPSALREMMLEASEAIVAKYRQKRRAA